tara:strand:+ start:177 stop:674 length:498 start_codon:yes stop_codon:yes gene_type:complete
MIDKRKNLVLVIQETISRLELEDCEYQWTNQGKCNCGHIIQTVTGKTSASIHKIALNSQGEWTDHAKNFCVSSGLHVDILIEELLKIGISLDQIPHLEYLSSPKITRYIPNKMLPLNHKSKEDFIFYLQTWKKVLKKEIAPISFENELINGIPYLRVFESSMSTV